MTELLSDQIRAYYGATTTPVDVDAIQQRQPSPAIRLVASDHDPMEDTMLAPNREQRPPRVRVVLAIAAAVATIAVVAGVIFASTPRGNDRVETDVAAIADEPEVTAPVESDVEAQDEAAVELTPDEQAAVDVAERYFTAFADGDVDAVLALSVPTSLNLSAAAEAGVVAWFVTDDGLVDRTAEALAGFKNYGPVWTAYADYLQAARPADYATACDPAAYDAGSVNYTNELAITEPCGQLVADVSDDVAAWIEAGSPELTAGS